MSKVFTDKEVIISKEEYNEENEISYLNFVLGYDLLNNMLKQSDNPECDISYDFCDYLSRHFIKSDEYQNTNYSTYEMLQSWLDKNKCKIKKEYNKYLNGDKNKEERGR